MREIDLLREVEYAALRVLGLGDHGLGWITPQERMNALIGAVLELRRFRAARVDPDIVLAMDAG